MRAGLVVGGIEVEVRVPLGPLETILTERYGPFLSAIIDPVCTVEMKPTERDVGPDHTRVAVVVDGSGAEQVVVSHDGFEAHIDLRGAGTVETAADVCTVDHFLRTLFGLLAPRHDAVMLHSCGVIMHGQSHVFAGRAGAGKSTLASIAGHRPLLSDDHVLVRRKANRWVGASTPFWGRSYDRPGPVRQAPLGKLWSLTHHGANEVVPMAEAEALSLVLGNAVLPGPQPALEAAIFTVATDLVGAVGAAELRFVPNPSVWDDIDLALLA